MTNDTSTPKREVRVAWLCDLKDRERIIVDVDGIGVGLYYLDGEVRAWLNICPHQGGPVCQGVIMPKTEQLVREGGKSGGLGFSKTERNIVCPWHGFEYSILTGRHPSDPGIGLRAIPVRVVDEDVLITI